MSTALALAQDFEDITAKYRLFQEQKLNEVYDEEKIFRDMDDREKLQRTAAFAEMFGVATNNIEEMFRVEDLQDKVVEVEKLTAEQADPFQAEMYARQKTVFAKPEIKKESKPKETEFREFQNPWSEKPAAAAPSNPATKPYQAPSATPAASPAAANTGTKPTAPNIYGEIMRIAGNVENIAHRTPKWDEPAKKPTGWGEPKKSFWQKCKEFIGSKKVRIMAKLGAMLSLQLFMAKLAGRYDIKNAGQFIGVIGLMLGTFYISKELQSDGFDVRGFGI